MNFFIIDGFNMAYRAHNVNFELRTASGNPTGMFFGFIRMVRSLKKRFQNYDFIVAWDRRPNAKYAIQEDYKGDRVSLPSVVMQQIPDIKIFLEHIGVTQYEKEGCEADDIIATLCESLKSDSNSIIVYSNDKDLLQLVETGKVVVFKPKVGNSLEKFYDKDKVFEEFNVYPENLACYRSFKGDSSDNIKGAPRIPRKVISSFVNNFYKISNIYSNIDSIKLTDYQRRVLKEYEERIKNNYKLINLDRNIEDMEKTEAKMDASMLKSLFEKYEIKSVNPDEIIERFKLKHNIRKTDPQPAYKLETYSLF